MVAWTSLSSPSMAAGMGPVPSSGAEVGRGEESVRAVAVEKTPEYAERRDFIGSRRS